MSSNKRYKGLKHQKTASTVPFLLLMTYSGSKIKVFGKKAIKNLVGNLDTREKRFSCYLIATNNGT